MDIRHKAIFYHSPIVKGDYGYYVELSEETVQNWIDETDSSKMAPDCFDIYMHFENDDIKLPDNVYWNEDGFLMIPVKVLLEVCDYCDGRGHYVNPNIDDHGLTADDFADDPDFEEAYFGGAFDMSCAACKGSGELKKPIYNQYIDLLKYAEKQEEYYEDEYSYERYMGY